jgi:CHAT domain-containing protein/Tfp pilus assembly protein PilF
MSMSAMHPTWAGAVPGGGPLGKPAVWLLAVTLFLALDGHGKAADEPSAEHQRLVEKARSLHREAIQLYQEGHVARAAELTQEVVAIREKAYPQEKYPQGHPELAQSLNSLGLLLERLGKYDRALSYHERSLAMHQALYPKEKHPQGHPHLAHGLTNLGLLLQSMGQNDRALPYQEQALAMYEGLYPKNKYPEGHPDLALGLNNLGALLWSLGEYSRALSYAERALAQYQGLYSEAKHPQGHPQLATSLNNLGFMLLSLGEPGQALPYVERALAMRRRLYAIEKYPQGHPALVSSLNSLGALLESQGEYGQALPYFEQALALRERMYPKAKHPQGHPELATSLHNLGNLLLSLGEPDQALPYLEQALAMCENLYPKADYPEGHPHLAHSLNDLGGLLKSMGQYGRARPYYERALAMRQSLYPEAKYPQGHPLLADTLNDLGILLMSLGEYGQALPYSKRALAMRQGLYPQPEYPQGHPELATSLDNLGFVLWFLGEPGPALTSIERALAMRESLTAAFLATASEARALNFLAKLPLTRDGYLSIARHVADTDPAAYTHVWQSKAAIARLLERRRQAVLLSDPTVRQLATELADTRYALAALLLAPAGRHKDQQQRLQDLNERKEKLERAIAEKLPAFAELRARDQHTPRGLIDRLPRGTVFIDLLRYVRFEQDPKTPGKKGEKQTACYAAFVLRPGQPVRRVELGEALSIERALREWQQAVAGGKEGRPEDRTAAQVLRQRLWEPLATHLSPDTETVYVAPDGPLTALPWAALPGRKPDTVLLEEYAVAVVPHGRLLLEQLRAGPPAAGAAGGRLLAVGAVRYDQAPTAAEPPRRLAVLDRGPAIGDRKLRWQDLPGTADELEQVQARAGPQDVVLRRGAEAGTAQLLRDLPQARWAHLATHGFFADPKLRSALQVDERVFARKTRVSGEVLDRSTFGARNPLVLSGLVLAGANLDQPDRGILTAEAIAGLPLDKLELAVLSACETGLGEVGGGEGVFGLQRAFHVAGCRTVVASLWKVDDQATAALMGLFYHHLWEEGKPPLEALREAQLAVYRHPERLPAYSRLRGPDLAREVRRPAGAAAPGAGARAATRLWAGFTLSGLGR